MIPLILIIIFSILCFLKILHLVYVFQIKEYRTDRFLSSLHDEGVIRIFYASQKLPAKSIRNVLITGISLLLLSSWIFLIKDSLLLVFVSLILYPGLGFLSAYAGVLVTTVIARIRREQIIYKATKHLSATKAIVIGITGSYGKTTTKDYLYEILSRQFEVAKTDENMNTEVGVAKSILKNVMPDTQYFIAEMGAYKKGEIKRICDAVHPTYGIITAIGNQHLDLFGSKENIIEGKTELLRSLPANGYAFVNTSLPKENIKTGIKAPISFFSNQNIIPYRADLFDDHMILANLTPCIMLAKHLGVNDTNIKGGIMAIRNSIHRLSRLKGINGCTVIDNSYSTNVEGFIHSIELLVKRREKNKIIVSRGIIELGREKLNSYDRILHVLTKSDVVLYTTDVGFNTRPNSHVHYFKNEQQLSLTIMNTVDKNTVFLFEGRFDKKLIDKLIISNNY